VTITNIQVMNIVNRNHKI